jgi:hypothetical protein
MPQYQNNGLNNLAVNPAPPVALRPQEVAYLLGTATTAGQPISDSNISFEAVTVGERSIAAMLAARPAAGNAPGLRVQVVARANTGAAEIDVQDAGVDAEGAYATPTGSATYKLTTWTALGGGLFMAFAELVPETGPFVTLKVIANPNAVSYWAKVTYV